MSTTPAPQSTAPAATAEATSTTSTAVTPGGSPAPAQTAPSGTESTTPVAATPAPEAPAAPVRIVPTTYTLTIPEGQSGPVLDAADVQAVAALAKTHQWTNEEAQAALQETHESFERQRTELLDALKRDPEVGGERLAAAQQAAQRALDRFLPATEPGGSEFRAFLNKTGYGNQKDLVKLLARIGTAMGEDSMVVRTPSAEVVDPVARLYDHAKKA